MRGAQSSLTLCLLEAAMENHFILLDVDDSSTDKMIKRAYRKACIKHHPDKKGGTNEGMHKLGTALDVLLNKDSKTRHLQATRPYSHGQAIQVHSLGVDIWNGLTGTAGHWTGLRLEVILPSRVKRMLCAENIRLAVPPACPPRRAVRRAPAADRTWRTRAIATSLFLCQQPSQAQADPCTRRIPARMPGQVDNATAAQPNADKAHWWPAQDAIDLGHAADARRSQARQVRFPGGQQNPLSYRGGLQNPLSTEAAVRRAPEAGESKRKRSDSSDTSDLASGDEADVDNASGSPKGIQHVSFSGFEDAALNGNFYLNATTSVSGVPIYETVEGTTAFLYWQMKRRRWALTKRFDPATQADLLCLVQRGGEVGLAFQHDQDISWCDEMVRRGCLQNTLWSEWATTGIPHLLD